MNEPSRIRLLDSDGEVEKSLLRAWRTRQPTEAARVRTLAAVGVGGALVTGAGASLVPGLPKGAIATTSLLKWLGVAGGIAATAGAAAYVVQQNRVEPAVTAPLQAAPTPRAEMRPLPPALIPEPTAPWQSAPSAVGPATPAPATLPAAAPPPAAASTARTVPASTSSLDQEVLAIDHARHALAGGDMPLALELADAYDARFPAGALTQESAEIRIEALYRSGKRAQGDRLATHFLAAHPTSPYVRVIRTLQAGTSAGATAP